MRERVEALKRSSGPPYQNSLEVIIENLAHDWLVLRDATLSPVEWAAVRRLVAAAGALMPYIEAINPRIPDVASVATHSDNIDGDTMLTVGALRAFAAAHNALPASLRERAVEGLVRRPVADFRDALRFGAAEAYLAERHALLRKIERHGILTVDVPASELPVALANRYLEIKRAARL